MPACSQIYLWMETLKYDALNKAAEKNNTTIEALLQPKLEELYCEYVPADLRKQIAEKLADILLEEEKAEHRKAECERKTVIKLCDVGGYLVAGTHNTQRFTDRLADQAGAAT